MLIGEVLSRRWQRSLTIAVATLVLGYSSICLFLFLRQRHLIYRPAPELSLRPDALAFKLPYQDVWIKISGTQAQLHGWWIPAPTIQEKFAPLPNEPTNVLTSPRVVLYFCGVGRNIGDYNYIARMSAFRQLGFSVLAFDYRGYGLSQGDFPNEQQVYQDGQAAWDYLRRVRQIPAQQILIYGESLGGAIALDLAIKHPDASGLIMQSSFTSMAEVIQHRGLLSIFPIQLLLTERFDSHSKLRSLRIPVLFLHGTADSIVPAEMSQRLYNEAPEPKQLFLISDAEHVRIYQPGEQSYLKAIQRFIGIMQQRRAFEKQPGGGSAVNLNELPGAELILPGLEDLRNGRTNTVGALLIAIASIRLTTAGLDIPKVDLAPEPELALYALLQNERDDAYSYYNALLNRLNSFCCALELSHIFKQSQ
jgi:uncharacterized protein